MTPPSELSLDFKPHSYSMLLKSFASGEHQQPDLKQLEDFLACLEDERLKIEAFKRELPLCMQLLSNAVEASRQKLQAVKSSNQGPRPVLEEFIPLKSPTADGEEDHAASKNASDKSNWMVSAQLWSQTPSTDNNGLITRQLESPYQTDMGLSITSSNLTLLDTSHTTKQRNSGAFSPFNKDRTSTGPNLPNPNLALANTNDHHLLEEKKIGSELIPECPTRETIITPGNFNGAGMMDDEPMKGTNNSADTLTTSNTTHTTNNNSSSNQPHRKARRCWSPDLHRRFVNALQMLGGSQVATPKQIRELMKVDGLTNDEVKSHLQKYRLHTRRPSPSPQPAAGGPAAQLVVLGGIWVPPEYAAHHSGATAALYGAAPHQAVGPEFYAAAGPHHRQLFHIHQQQQMQMHQIHLQQQQQHHQAVQVYNNKASSRTHSSPESDARGAVGDRSESIEDGKSESGSWKGGESVENGRERMKVGARRDGGEESNGSEITLKF
uniref:HTH myb-type domain-containing protein n=1 Tax=Kalanchoe fedtschenkoi TaxID=63787 RepID=A0A7N0TAY8_KALFE